jgi:hypothetical protein
MARPAATRLYLKNGASSYARFLWISHIGPTEMMVGFSGLARPQARMRLEWPDRTLPNAELGGINYRWRDAEEVGHLIDHITCHGDGRFHVKLAGIKPPYVHVMSGSGPLNRNTPTFLRFLAISDTPEHYQVIGTQPKPPHAWFEAPPSQSMYLEAAFAGAGTQSNVTS